MKHSSKLAIVIPESKTQLVPLLQQCYEQNFSHILQLDHSLKSLEVITNEHITHVIVYDMESSSFAKDFIVKASIQKIFQDTTFYLAKDHLFSDDDKVKYMTLGYSEFIEFYKKEALNHSKKNAA